MTAKHNDNSDLDVLLKGALADDLPADVEAGMRDRIRIFRNEKMKGKASVAAGAWLFRRTAWAVISILMLVAGILLQGSQSRSALADRIARVQSEVSGSGSVGRSI
jgi:hypothetical protein